ncbi:MAG: Rap1a/Tai family immunity protein [Pseudomonas sp.]
MRKTLIAITSAMLISAVHADDGHDLLNNCQKFIDQENGVELDQVGDIKAAKCLAFISGFGGADSLSPLTRNGQRMFCMPNGISRVEVAKTTVAWMEENEEALDYGDHEVLAIANIVNFPCSR